MGRVKYCDFKGCTNKAGVLAHMKELKDEQGGVWKLFVAACDTHFDNLVGPEDKGGFTSID